MKKSHKIFRLPLLLAATLALTGCKFIDTLINTALINVAMQLPYVMNHLHIDIIDEMEIEFTQFEEEPTTVGKQAQLNYFLDALVIPKNIVIEGFDYPVRFEWEIVGNNLDTSSFFVLELGKDDLPPEMVESIPAEIDAYVIMPVGNFNGLDGVTTIDELTTKFESYTQSELIDFAAQDEGSAAFKITGIAGEKTKSKTYYFNFSAPEFGEQIVESVFDSGFIVNIFDAMENTIESVANPATDIANALGIEYLKQTIAIPKAITLDQLNETVVFTLEFNNPEYFFVSSILKPITEIDPGNSEITGDVEVYTLTPIGDYDLPGSVVDVDTLKDHLEGLSAKALYNAAVQEQRSISITVTATVGSHAKSETYFFTLVEPPLDQEIIDYAMDSEYIINTVFYKDVETITSVTPLPDEVSKRADIEYLTETIIIPESVILADFGNRNITFTITMSDESLFYQSRKATTIDGNDVNVLTLTPIGDYIPIVGPNNLSGLADEFMNMDKEDLYDYANQADYEFEISVTASLADKVTTKTYYFKLVAADVDEDIVEYLIEHESLLNVITYEDVNNDSAIESIGNLATDSNNRYEVEYLTETLIIPESITLAKFGNTVINLTSSITVPGGQTIFEASKTATIETNSVAAKTLTPLGTYNAPGVTPGNLNELSDAISLLHTKNLYSYSQGPAADLDITISAELNGHIRSTTLYVRLVPAQLDKKIGERIMDDFAIVNIGDFEFNYHGVMGATNDALNPESARFFVDTIIIPKSFSLVDYGNKDVNFAISVNGASLYDGIKTLTYEAQTVDVYTLTPTGDYDTSPYADVTSLLNHFKTKTPLDLVLMNDTQVPIPGVTIVITASINSVEVATRTYYFDLIHYTI